MFENDAGIDGSTGRPVGPTNELSLSVTQGCTLGWDTDQPFGLMAIDPDQPFGLMAIDPDQPLGLVGDKK